MSHIIDRRKTDRNKNTNNRSKFLNRTREAMKKALKDSLQKKSVKGIAKGGSVSIPSKGIREPNIVNGGGKRSHRDHILPGNDKNTVGDRIRKPEGGGGGGCGREGSNDPLKDLDQFQFTLSKEEFLDLFFEDLELPDLVKTALKDIKEFSWRRAGFSPFGIPANIDIQRTFITSLGRRMALAGQYDRLIKECEETIPLDEERLARLKKERELIPFLDDFDMRYRLFTKQPNPSTKAVMFCLMDVSGSMGEYEKDLAKRFFMLLYLFLIRKYDLVEIVFVRHTTDASEVSEDEFFYSKETGGTIVSSGLELVANIIQERYATTDWNIYVSQCSDGDNYSSDNDECRVIIEKRILPYVQYFAYVQVGHDYSEEYRSWGLYLLDSGLWNTYEDIAKTNPRMQLRKLNSPADIYPVFSELFKKGIKL